MIEHGGNLDWAIKNFGGEKKEWIDLSTGINPNSYPLETIQSSEFQALPTQSDIKNLVQIAREYYKTNADITAVSGVQTAINIFPYLFSRGNVSIIEPTYNEYKNAFSNANWKVNIFKNLNNLQGSNLAIICNPNNPDGKIISKEQLIDLSTKVGFLIIDESFMDLYPNQSLSEEITKDKKNIIVLKSFGKFFGLAGVRLGFILSSKKIAKHIEKFLGPWQISNLAIIAGVKALKDKLWISKNIESLKTNSSILDNLADSINLKLLGGTYLYRLYETSNSLELQNKFATKMIWTRTFSYSKHWIRLGLPNEKLNSELSLRFSEINHN